VAAIGKLNEFPDDTYHAQTVLDRRFVTPEGFFAPNFSCFGPQVAVCAPGVAIISSVPPRNFAAWDGTSMAAPHVTGLAALILAHHPSFQGPFRQRNAQRVEQLFQVIKMSARPVNLGDPNRTGSGLPDAQRALPVFQAGVQLTTVNELLQYVATLLPGAAPRPSVPFGAAPTAGVAAGLPPTQQARDYLIEEMKRHLQEANLS
jgi:subtilisin family serine protease